MSGRSGLPKLRQSVKPIGAAPGTDEIPRRLGHGQPGPFIGIQQAIAAVAIDRHRHSFLRALDPHHRRVGPWTNHRIRPHHMIILFVHPPLTGDRRRLQQGQQGHIRIFHIGNERRNSDSSAYPDTLAADRAVHSEARRQPMPLAGISATTFP